LAILKYIVFKKLEVDRRNFEIIRSEKWGGDISYTNYADLENDFKEGRLSSIDLKPFLAEEIIKLITTIRAVIKENAELLKKAYPSE